MFLAVTGGLPTVWKGVLNVLSVSVMMVSSPFWNLFTRRVELMLYRMQRRECLILAERIFRMLKLYGRARAVLISLLNTLLRHECGETGA